MKKTITRSSKTLRNPLFLEKLLNDERASVFWFILRVWLGSQWIIAAFEKVGNPVWTQTGEALKNFWSANLVIPDTGRPPIAFGWYRSFIQMLLDAEAYTWFAKLVAYGELLVGIALVLGAFTGFAAFFGAFMNWNYMMAGSASSNPVLFLVALGLIMAWKVAGYIGADYFLLPWLGTPWRYKGDLAEIVEE